MYTFYLARIKYFTNFVVCYSKKIDKLKNTKIVKEVAVPEWKFFYVHSLSDLNHADSTQKEFYYYFKSEFINGNFIDVGASTSYVYILILDLIEDYKKHEDYLLTKSQLNVLRNEYPHIVTYTFNLLNDFVRTKLVGSATKLSSKIQNTKNCRWVPVGKEVVIAGKSLTMGNFYVGERFVLPKAYRASAWSQYLFTPTINPELEVSDLFEVEKPFSSYTDMTPYKRSVYLKWLSGEISILEVPIGLIFLYFYGLEIRMFVDSNSVVENRIDILKIAIEFSRVEGLDTQVRQFLDRFIDNSLIKIYPTDPLYFMSKNELMKCQEYEKFVVPRIISDCEGAVKEDVAHKLAATAFSLYKDIPVHYHDAVNEEYKKLFSKYNPNGVAVTRMNYVSSNYKHIYDLLFNEDTTYGYLFSEELDSTCILYRGMLKNEWEVIKAVKGPLFKIKKDFSAYCKWEADTLFSLLSLPSYIDVSTVDKVVQFYDNLTNMMQNDSFLAIEFDEFLDMLEYTRNDEKSLYISYVDSIIGMLARIGCGVVPNNKIDDGRLNFGSKCVIYKQSSVAPPINNLGYKKLEIFAKLASSIFIMSDITKYDREYIYRYITSYCEDDSSKEHLCAYFEWLNFSKYKISVALMPSINRLLSREEQIDMCSKLLVLFCVNSDISSKRIVALKRAFKLLGEDSSDIHSRIHRVVTGEAAGFATGKSFEGAGLSTESGQKNEKIKFHIDNNKLSKLEQQTKESHAMLSVVFDREHDSEHDSKSGAGDESKVKKAVSDESATDGPMLDILKVLLSKDVWERSEVDALCRERGQMLGSILEKINDYSYSKVDDAVIDDDDDTIYIATEYKEQLIKNN